MARRYGPTLAEGSEPTILVPSPCMRCATCEDCGGTHVNYLEIHDIPVDAALDVESGLVGEPEYRVNGFRANKAAFDLAWARLNG